MAIGSEEWNEIERALAAGAASLSEMRRRWPHLSWTGCDGDDVFDQPFRRFAAFDVHLLDGSGHCPQLTDDPARASGVILASRRAP